jgi:hypothetical protein
MRWAARPPTAFTEFQRALCPGSAAPFATALLVDIVASAVGLPQEGRERMLVWAEQMFNCFGPLNDRTRSAAMVVPCF